MKITKPKNKGVVLLENQLKAISYYLHYFEQYLLLKEHQLTCSKVVPLYLFKRSMFDNACLIINALFGCDRKKSDNIRDTISYLSLLKNKSGLNKHVEKIITIRLNTPISNLIINEKENLLKNILGNNLSKKIDEKSLENLMSYRDKIFCHQDDYNPDEENIYFPIIFGFLENAKSLFEFISDVYNISKNASNWGSMRIADFFYRVPLIYD